MTDENRSLKDKIRDFLEEKGVYVVLLSSVAIVGVAAAAAYWPCLLYTSDAADD